MKAYSSTRKGYRVSNTSMDTWETLPPMRGPPASSKPSLVARAPQAVGSEPRYQA